MNSELFEIEWVKFEHAVRKGHKRRARRAALLHLAVFLLCVTPTPAAFITLYLVLI